MSELAVVEPVVVVTRHPDFEDSISLYGVDARVVYVDLGRSFDTTPTDAEEASEWAEGTWASVADLPAGHPARAEVLDVIATTCERFFRVAVVYDKLALTAVEEER